jgi:hypothetical protein
MKDELVKWMSEHPEEVMQVSNAITNKIIDKLLVESVRWGSFLLIAIIFLVLVWYFVRVSMRSQADNVIITHDLSEMREANLLAKKEYLVNIEVLKQDLYKQAEQIRKEYTDNLDVFKDNLVKELNIDADILESYKEFYKIKAIVYQDLDNLSKESIVPVVYNRLHKSYRRLVDFEKTYGYILPKGIADALSALILHCKGAITKDSIKDSKFVATNIFINSLDNTNEKFRAYLRLS